MVSLFFLHFATTVPHTVISNSEKFTHPILQYSSCQHLTLPAGPASLHRCSLSMSLYTYSSWFNYQRRCVASPPFPIQAYYLSMTTERRPSWTPSQAAPPTALQSSTWPNPPPTSPPIGAGQEDTTRKQCLDFAFMNLQN